MQLERDFSSKDEKKEGDELIPPPLVLSPWSRIIPAIEYTLQSRYENRETYFKNEDEDLRVDRSSIRRNMISLFIYTVKAQFSI